MICGTCGTVVVRVPTVSGEFYWECPKCSIISEETQERHYKTHQRAQDSAFNNQVGGDHYTKLAIQPMEYSFKNKLDPCQHTAIKYITRFRDKGGRQDLEKAIDCIQMLIEMEYGK